MSDRKTTRRPARTQDAREQELIALSYDEAERRIRDHTASSQVLCHFLSMGSSREREAREKLENENALLKAKVAQIESDKRREELYAKAIESMKRFAMEDVND